MPLNWVSYGLDYLLWGMNPSGYHFTSLVVHAANAVLFYFLSLRLLRLGFGTDQASPSLPIRRAAGFSALLFSLHPLQVEVVAWTLGREIAIAGFFFILTLLCYLRATENASAGLPSHGWMGAAWVFYALSLLGKEVALTLPFALLILDAYPLRRLGGARGTWFGRQVRQVWWEKLPFLFLAMTFALRGIMEKQQAGSIYPIAGFGFLPRIAQVLYSLAFYPWKTLIPTELSPLYPVHPFTGLWNPPTLLSAAFVISLSLWLLLARHRWPAGLAAWTFYILLLAPLTGVVAFGPYRVADRFSYVPSLGWSVLAGGGLVYGWQLLRGGRLRTQTVALLNSGAVLILITLGVMSWRQTMIWHDSETLWRHALAVDERSSIAHNNLALVLAGRGDIDEAINRLRRSVEIDPAFVEAQTNLGNFLGLQGFTREAIAHLRRALKIDPTFVNAHNVLGNLLAANNELDEAITQFRQALESNAQSAVTHYNLARVLAKQGRTDEAMIHYRQSLAINTQDADVHNNLGLLLAGQNRLDEAMAEFREALRVDPTYAKAHFNLGKLFFQQDRLDDAEQAFRRAARYQPRVAEIHEYLARVFARQGKKNEAVQEYQEALRLLESQRQWVGSRK
jgi:tetratricopeptide (TPR) repeat protein